MATILAGSWFAACCGVSTAAVAALARTAIPEMKGHGYHKRLSAGCVAGAGLLSILIPPSVPLVLYGMISGESVGKCLLAGVIPGLLTTMVFSVEATVEHFV